MEEHRPNPDKLLQRAQEEERQGGHGRLKIYLGAAPGVGKTHEMLHDALSEHEKGLDVVIGVAESHGREDINAILKKFEILPKQLVDYHGKPLLEFDLNGALNRHPALMLMDEMAHANAPGLRHKKRWQDIKELLDRGIDVYTTLNVQHIESLNDDVSQIIHAPVKETVPDSMIEMADTIELVDIPPEELLKRLHEGKVYFPEQATLAADLFFRKGNLIALRELALRTTAERVGAQVLLYRQGQGIKHIWPTREKILVCVGPEVESLKLIRAAKRMANNFQAEWIAVYIDMPRVSAAEENRHRAIENLHLAEQLGAETRILTGFDIVKEVMNFANEQNVTQIMVWKYIRPRWQNLFFRSLADEVVRHSGEIDVYIMTGAPSDMNKPKLVQSKINTSWWVYGIPLAMSALVISFYFFTHDKEYSFILSVIVFAILIISRLTILTHRQARAARLIENQTSALYMLSRQLASTRGIDKLLNIGISYISNVFDSDVLALLPKNDRLAIRAACRTNAVLDEKEQGVAQWVYELGQMAGLGTDSLSFSKALYLPLLGSQGVMGVLRIYPAQPERLISPERMRLLEACANQIALALEVDRLQEKTKKSEVKIEADRARSALLQAVSHDLRTPLVAIMGAASTQIEMANELDASKIKKLGKEIYFEAD